MRLKLWWVAGAALVPGICFASGAAGSTPPPAPLGVSTLPDKCEPVLVGGSDRPRITRVAVRTHGEPKNQESAGELSLHDEVHITLENAGAFQRCIVTTKADPVLFLGHVAMADVKPRSSFVDPENRLHVSYRLERTTAVSQGWNELLVRSWLQERPLSVKVGIGPNALFETATSTSSVKLNLGQGNRWIAVGMGALSILALFVMFRDKSLLRDRQTIAGASSSLSLGRVVMAVWLLTTLSAIVLVFINGGTVPPLDGGLQLMLLASGLTLGSGSAIDVIRKLSHGSKGWWVDLMDDDHGLALHRLQALLVNLLLLGVVWWELISRGSIVNIDHRWATLLGISSGIYLYGKATEPR
jgi:hypothetical protein